MIVNDSAGLLRILKDNRVVAVVGLSANPTRPSHVVAQYLLERGYTIIPVNPGENAILGQKCYASLREIPQKVDIVDCFRKSEEIPPLAEDAIAIGARVLWMQLGVINPSAAQRASEAGLDVVEDRCIKIEHARLLVA
ncbi:MAG: CoA-binding protein [Sterolibacterium sp.]